MSIRLILLTLVTITALPAAPAHGDDAAAATANGVVVAPDGTPVRDAEVIVATPDRAAWPNLPPAKRDEWQRGAGTSRTDEHGRFTVELAPGAALLSVHHPKLGYAEVRPAALAEQPEVKLERWCRVEGVLKLGAKTAPAGAKVYLGNFGWGVNAARVHYGYVTETDARGRYVLDRVPAGVAQVAVRASDAGSRVEQYVGTDPEKPTRLDLGGAGRPVVGKLVLGGGLNLKDLDNHAKPDRLYSTSYFRRKGPWPGDGAPRVEGTAQDHEDAVRAWRRTPEAVDAYRDEYRCNLDFQPDGSFRVDDVPPGTYTLSLSIGQLGSATGDPVAKLETDVVVAEPPALPTDEPLDLGALEPVNAGGGGGGAAEGL